MANNKSKATATAREAAQMRIIIICVCVALALVLVGVAAVIINYALARPIMEEAREEINSMAVSDFTETDRKTDYVKITVKDHGDIVVRLRDDVAPKTVKNFKNLVSKDFYNGLTIHRVVKGFMIQGGDPKGDDTGGSGTTIKGEFNDNGVENNLSHIKGVISMARRGDNMNSATSQFFICNADASESLDGQYASFGYVVAGLEVVDSISAVEVKANAKGEKSVPVTPIVIEKVVFVKK